MRLLRRRWLDHDIFETPEPAAMRKPGALGPAADHHVERFIKPCFGLFGRDLKTLEFAVAVAFADAEIEAAAGNQIERCRLFCEQHWIVPRQHHHRRTKAQPRGAHSERGQQHQGRRHLVPAGEMMLDQKARYETEPFGRDVDVEVIAEALPGLWAKIAAVSLRRREQTEFHDRVLFALLEEIFKTAADRETPGVRHAHACAQARRSDAALETPCRD